MTPKNIKKDSRDYYLYLLEKIDWFWSQSDDHRFLDRNLDMKKEIDRLQPILDPNAETFNLYSPYKK